MMLSGAGLAVATLAAAGAIQEGRGEAAVAFRAARIWHDPSGPEPWLDDAWLVVRGGKVEAVVADPAALPPLAEVADLGDAVIVPGLVAADSRLAGSEPPPPQGLRALGAQRRALDDFDPFADTSAALSRGVTAVYLPPPRRLLVGGRGAVVKTAGERRVLAAAADLRVSLEPEAFNPAPYFRPPIPPTSEQPLEPAAVQPPSSRAGALLVLRETAEAARAGGEAASDPHLLALREFLRSGQSLRVAAGAAGEVEGALAVADDWKVPLVVEGGGEAAALAERVGRARAAVVFRVPLFRSLADMGPRWRPPAPDALRRLRDAGASVAVVPGPEASWPLLLEAASAAVGLGLSEAEALAAVTSAAAAALGVDGRVGSLQAGHDADFVVLSGPPLDPATTVARVYVDGKRAWSAPRGAAEAVVVRAGTLWPGEGPPLRGGAEVLLRDGKVEAAGARVPHPPGARVVDAGPEAHITPGFVDLRSSLGLGNQAPDPQVTLGLLGAGSRLREEFLQVARAGVTSALVAPRNIPAEGARVQVLKTAAGVVEQAYHGEREIVLFSVTGGDHAARGEELQRLLERGKSYFEQWEKWRGEHKKWEEAKAAKEASDREAAEAALRERLAQGRKEEPKKEEKEEKKEEGPKVEEAPKEVDPINGLWQAEVQDPRLGPEAITLQGRLRHEGSRLKGVFSSPDVPDQQSVELDGTWDAAAKTMRFEISTQMGRVTIQGQVDAPDHMQVRVELHGFGAVDFEAVRIEVEEAGAAPALVRGRRKDDELQPPKRDWKLEGLRALFEKRGVALVAAERADEIRTAVEVFGGFALPLHILGGGEAGDVAELLRERGVGVVVGPSLVRRERNADVVPAAELRSRGLLVGFQSAAAGGAARLPDTLALAARYGLGADQALEGLTAHAARLLGLEGSLGRVAPGCDGDVVVHSGPPLDLRSRVLHVFVNGREVPREEEAP